MRGIYYSYYYQVWAFSFFLVVHECEVFLSVSCGRGGRLGQVDGGGWEV
jgi:hypothetical protein